MQDLNSTVNFSSFPLVMDDKDRTVQALVNASDYKRLPPRVAYNDFKSTGRLSTIPQQSSTTSTEAINSIVNNLVDNANTTNQNQTVYKSPQTGETIMRISQVKNNTPSTPTQSAIVPITSLATFNSPVQQKTVSNVFQGQNKMNIKLLQIVQKLLKKIGESQVKIQESQDGLNALTQLNIPEVLKELKALKDIVNKKQLNNSNVQSFYQYKELTSFKLFSDAVAKFEAKKASGMTSAEKFEGQYAVMEAKLKLFTEIINRVSTKLVQMQSSLKQNVNTYNSGLKQFGSQLEKLATQYANQAQTLRG